ncbi:MAG: GGDEF domain-containing protein [Pseudomonadales bacterium]
MSNTEEYLRFIEPSKRLQIRLVALLTAAVYIAYSFIDALILSEHSAAFASPFHRYIVPLILLLVSGLSLFEQKLKWSVYLLMLAPVLAGSMNNYLILFEGENPIYLAEVYIGIMWLYAFSGLSWRDASYCVACFFGIAFVMHLYRPLDSNILAFHLFWSSFVIAFGLLLALLLEQRNKRIFATHQELVQAAYQDTLTGAFNRKKFDEFGASEIDRCSRFKHTFSLALLDIDHFKHVNDTYGHSVGDTVLQEIVELLKSSIRNTDLLVRWGGEEFVILCVESNKTESLHLMTRISERIQAHSFSHVGHKTVSIGLTQLDADDSLDSLIKRADQALYQAKEQGRNTIVCL